MPINISRKSNGNGINYTYEADGPADHALIPNDIYFRDKTDSLIYYKNSAGTVLSLFNEIDTPTTDALVHVMPSGSDATGQRADISKPFLTLEAARDASLIGDTIIVYPGTYTVTTTDANGLSKVGVHFYFYPGCTVSKATAGPMFSNVGLAQASNVYGKAVFSISGTGTTFIAEFGNALEHTFEATSCTSIAPCVGTFMMRNNTVVTMNVDTVTSSSHIFAEYNHGTLLIVGTRLKINGKNWTANGGIINGAYYMEDMDILINANILRSQTTTLFFGLSQGTLTINADRILCDVPTNTYLFQIGNVSDVTISVVCSFCIGAAVSGGNTKCYIQGRSRNNTINSGYLECSSVERFTSSGGRSKITQSLIDESSTTYPLYVSGGIVDANIMRTNGHFLTAGVDFEVTGGVLNLHTIETFSSGANRGTGVHRLVNGGTLNLYGDLVIPNFVDGPPYISTYGIRLQSGTLNIYGAIYNLCNNALVPADGHGIIWSGGKLICNGTRLYKYAANAAHIRATTAGLQLRVLAGGLSTNTNSGLLDGQSSINRIVVAANNLATQVRITVQGNPAETFNVPIAFGTTAAIAAQLVTLINASGTLNASASQDNPGVDTYLYVTNDAVGLTQTIDNLINTSTNPVRDPGYSFTEIAGGLILQSTNIE